MKPRTPGQRWWYGEIEKRAYFRLHALQLRKVRGGALWDGVPPVPIDHVLEHLLGLSICMEEIEEPAGGVVLGCLRVADREVVLNERHGDLFKRIPGLRRFTLGHEAGHEDCFGDSAAEHEQGKLLTGAPAPNPMRANTVHGEGRVLGGEVSALLRGLAPEERTEVLRLYKERVEHRAAGEDSPLVRRAVDHYAASLLMPADLVRAAAPRMGIRSHAEIRALANQFEVSSQAMRFRLEEIGVIHGVDERTGEILLTDPAQNSQCSLL